MESVVKKKNSIEFLRFVLCCIVCLHHFRSYGNNGQKFSEGVFMGGYLGVDIFFVIAGYFMMQHFTKQAGKSTESPENAALYYLKGRLTKLVPHHLFSWMCMALLLSIVLKTNPLHEVLLQGAWELVLLKATGLGNNFSVNGVSWYLSAMLLASYPIYWILCIERRYRGNNNIYLYFFAPLVFLITMSSIWKEKQNLNYWTQSAVIFTGGFWRGASEIGLGCIVFSAVNKKTTHILKEKPILITTFLLIGWSLIIAQTWFGNNRNDFLIPLGAGMLIGVQFSADNYFDRVLDNRISAFLGRISFPMFLNQWIILRPVLNLFKGGPFWPVALSCLTAIFVFSVFSDWLVNRIVREFV